MRDFESISTTLLMGVRSKDDEAWKRLDDLFRPDVEQWLLAKWGIEEDRSRELAQNVLTRVVLAIDSFERGQSGTFRGWLWTLAKHEAMDYFRRRKRNAAVGGTAFQDHLSNVPDRPPAASDDDHSVWIERLLNSLKGTFSEQTCTIFRETVLASRSNVDVADELGISSTAVRQAKHRVITRIRRDWDELFGEWPFKRVDDESD